MTRLTRTIRSSYSLSLRDTVQSHGWVFLPPFAWDEARGTLSRLESGGGKSLLKVRVSQLDSTAYHMVVTGDRVGQGNANRLQARVRRWLSTDWNPAGAVATARGIAPDIAAYIEQGGGRFLRGSTFFEDFVKTVCTINASWGFTVKMVSKMVEELGGGAFPVPAVLLDAGEDYLKNKARCGYRALVLIRCIRELLERGLMDPSGESTGVSRTDLLQLPGIGPYAATHLGVLLHDFSRIPVDSEVRPYCAATYGVVDDEIEDYFAPWGAYRFLGYKLRRIVDRTNWIGKPK